MIRRNARLRREYLYRKSLEGAERVAYERKRAIRQALEGATPRPPPVPWPRSSSNFCSHSGVRGFGSTVLTNGEMHAAQRAGPSPQSCDVTKRSCGMTSSWKMTTRRCAANQPTISGLLSCFAGTVPYLSLHSGDLESWYRACWCVKDCCARVDVLLTSGLRCRARTSTTSTRTRRSGNQRPSSPPPATPAAAWCSLRRS